MDVEEIRNHFASPPSIKTKVMEEIGLTEMDAEGKQILIQRALYQAANVAKKADHKAYAFLIAVAVVHELGHWKLQKYRCNGSVHANSPQKPFTKESGEYLEKIAFGGVDLT
jgi:hypothetical protein